MTYANPALGVLHALRSVGGAAITSNNAITNTEKAYLFDGRRELFQFDASETDHYLQIDLGTASPNPFDRLVILPSHNITGTIVMTEDDNPGFGSPTGKLSAAATTGTIFDEALLSDISERYIRVYFPTGGGQWSLPELWLTERRLLTAGSDWPWEDAYRYNVLDVTKPSGDVATLELGTRQRVFRFNWEGIESADQAIFAALLAGPGRARPFLFWPPYGADPVMVKLARDPAREIGAGVPQSAELHNVTIELLELIA